MKDVIITINDCLIYILTAAAVAFGYRYAADSGLVDPVLAAVLCFFAACFIGGIWVALSGIYANGKRQVKLLEKLTEKRAAAPQPEAAQSPAQAGEESA